MLEILEEVLFKDFPIPILIPQGDDVFFRYSLTGEGDLVERYPFGVDKYPTGVVKFPVAYPFGVDNSPIGVCKRCGLNRPGVTPPHGEYVRYEMLVYSLLVGLVLGARARDPSQSPTTGRVLVGMFVVG